MQDGSSRCTFGGVHALEVGLTRRYSSLIHILMGTLVIGLLHSDSVSTTSLFDQGLSKLLRQFLQVDETIEDCWEGCTGVLRVIACCLTPSRLLCTASDEYWQGRVHTMADA